MDTRYYHSGRTRTRGSAAALIAFVLSLVFAPSALAEPFEGELSNTATTEVEPARGWEHNKNHVEYLENQLAAEASDNSAYRAQQDAYLRYLEQKAAAASGGARTVEISADDSGRPWLVGAGFATAVAIASIVLAMVRSRRQEAVATVQRLGDQVNV